MNKWTTRIKWIAPLLMIAVLFATTTVAYGGLRWSGIDPQIKVNGHKIAATVYIPTTEACYIDSSIYFRMVLPYGSEWDGDVDESHEKYDCDGDGDGDHTITTYTDVTYANVNRMYVAAKVSSDDRFRIKVQIKMDGRTVSRCRGYSDRWTKCRGFNVDAEDDDGDDEKKGKRKHHRGR